MIGTNGEEAMRQIGIGAAIAVAVLALTACNSSNGNEADAPVPTTVAAATTTFQGTSYSSGPANLRKAFENMGVTMSDSDLALTVPAAQTTCDTITNSQDAAKAYQAAKLIAQTKFSTEETAGWFVDQSIYAFCPSMSSLAQAPQSW